MAKAKEKVTTISNEPETATATATASQSEQEAGAGAGMVVRMLALDQILVDDQFNSRRFKSTDKEIEELARDINVRGQRVPVLVRAWEDGAAAAEQPYILVGGFRRFAAIQKLNMDGHELRIAANVIGQLDNANAYRESIAENSPKLRKNPSLMDMAYQIKELKGQGLNHADTAKEIGASGAWTSDVGKLVELPVEIQRQIHLGKIPYSVARQLPGLPEEDRDALLKMIEEGGQSATKLAEQVNKAKGKKAKRRKRGGDGEEKRSWGTFKECLAVFEELATAPKDEEGNLEKQNKAEEKVTEIFGVVVKFMAKKIGQKALRNQIINLL